MSEPITAEKARELGDKVALCECGVIEDPDRLSIEEALEELAAAQERLQTVDRWIEHCRGRHDAAIADCLVDWLNEPETVDELAEGAEHAGQENGRKCPACEVYGINFCSRTDCPGVR